MPRGLLFVIAALLSPLAAHAGQPGAPIQAQVISRDAAEGQTTIRATRLSAPLRVDGQLDEALYTSVPAMSDFVQVEPQFGAPATEKTDVWLAFDNENFYLTFRCWDSQPERRVSTEMRRDGQALYSGNDVINFFLDTFLDRRNGISMTINSLGGRSDGQVINGQYNGDWNIIWDVATGTFDGGWTLEVALPFKSLRYSPGQAQTWGFNVGRTVRWRNEISTLIPVPPWRGMNSIRQPQLAATVVGIEAPPGSNNLEIKPYAVSNVTTNGTANGTTVPRRPSTFDGDVGLDVKYGVTQNLVADFTYNTDFAQVEADEQQVNLTRFNLFFPEKRDFFLENQGTFSFGGTATSGRGGDDTPVLFYSRRIGLDEGRQVPIVGGGRLTGRVGAYSIGLMDIQTRASGASRATNFSTVRVKRDIFGRSSVGLLLTGRSVGQGGVGSNTAYGADGTFNFFTYLTINSYWARTHSDGRNGDDTSYRTFLDYAGDRYGVQLEQLAVGDNFNPEVGFVRRDDIRRSSGLVRFSPRPASIESVRKFSGSAAVIYVENGAGRVEAREQSADVGIEFQNADVFTLSYTGTYEFVPRPFRIDSEVTVPVGGYSYDTVGVAYTLGPQRVVSAGFLAEYGTFYSGHRTALSITRGRLNLDTRLSLEPTYTVNWVDLREGSFTTHLAGSRVTYTMTPQMFASALVQFNSANNAVTANVRLRWEYQPGSELFVVYNDDRDTRARGFPELANRAFIVKINRLFRF